MILCAAMLFTACAPAQAPAAPAAPAVEPAAPAAPAAEPAAPAAPAEPAAPTAATELTVVTMYGGEDGNRPNYEQAIADWQAQTGITVLDNSGTSNEEWKAKVNTDFETGTEPDVLLYFNGADADSIVNAGKVMSLDEIRAAYPDYGANMVEDSLLPATNGIKYTLPINGYWEALYVNTKLLSDLGIAIPDNTYTWDQFIADCQIIKDAGYVPIAASLQEVPHYWFEFAVMNNGNVGNHLDLPASADDPTGQKWVAALEDIKSLYEMGFFPENTLTATDNETFQIMFDGDAAFAIDGSWKVGAFVENAGDHIDDYKVLYVPGKGQRTAGDIIGGLSSGYYITKKAWDDPAQREAAVNFVMYMTSDPLVNKFSAQVVATSALKNPQVDASNAESTLHASALQMLNDVSGVAPAVQDTIKAGKADLLNNVRNVVAGEISAADAVNSAIALFNTDEPAA